MLGLHFFMPAHLIPLVEVVRSVHSDVKQAERVGEIMSSLGKRPVQVKKDVIGFLGNRIQGALMREALWLIEQGVASPEDIDATVRLSFGFRYAAAGPIVQKEHSGWDTTCAVAKIIWPDLSNAKGPPPILQRNVDEGRIGFKTKRGFFEWDDESIAKERARYERALRKCLEIFKRGRNSLGAALRQRGRDHDRRRRSGDHPLPLPPPLPRGPPNGVTLRTRRVGSRLADRGRAL